MNVSATSATNMKQDRILAANLILVNQVIVVPTIDSSTEKKATHLALFAEHGRSCRRFQDLLPILIAVQSNARLISIVGSSATVKIIMVY